MPSSMPNFRQELKEDFRIWKQKCSVKNFTKLVGICESEDSILPNPVLEARTYALEHLRTSEGVNFFSFVSI